jgi:mannose-6-phosphate isomerase
VQAYPVKFTPIPQKRIWGGSKLKEWFRVEEEGPIGEYWVLSGHPNGMSVVMNGEWAGKTIDELITEHPDSYLGQAPQKRFPLLIKFLEANDDLSVQVHPDDDFAQTIENDYGKTEAWYILDCEKDAHIVYGHKFESEGAYHQAIEEQKVADSLTYRKIDKDQMVFVPSRTLHALLAGTIVLEIQQTSDVTYRVYDWDRVDEQGQGRELHVDKAADVMVYREQSGQKAQQLPKKLVQMEKVQHELLVSCPYFTIERLSINNELYPATLGKKGNPDILIVTEGEGELESQNGCEPVRLRRGDTLLIPSDISKYSVRTNTHIQLIKTYY